MILSQRHPFPALKLKYIEMYITKQKKQKNIQK